MFRHTSLFAILCLFALNINAQKKVWYAPSKIGFVYGYGEQGSVVLKNKDYSYSVNSIKAQFFYPLRKGTLSLDLIVEPTIGFAKHQLLNFYFIEPDNPDYLAKREEFTQSKLLSEYILNIDLIVRHKIYKSHSIYALVSFGPMLINKRTERLAKGFAFAESIGMGISTKIAKKLYFDIRGRLRHISNAELQQPNSGINVVILETGFSFNL
ncbi:MAG: acyloxyacyl hydrolase [Flavobacteriaceae bacterium]|nr:acyloxyacyl hydrolase [Flavobacteriaceae bacterium]